MSAYADPALLHDVLDAIADVVYVKDREGRYLFANAACAQLFGIDKAAMLERTYAEFFGADDATTVQVSEQRILAIGVPQTFEFVISAGGAPRVYITTKSPYRDATGQIIGVIGISRDVTALKQAEAATRAAQQMEDQLEGVRLAARELAYLLNNALAAPVGAFELLLQHPGLPVHLRELVRTGAASLAEVREHLGRLQRVVRIETKDTMVGRALDLDRSIQGEAIPSTSDTSRLGR